ncbi:MAG: peptidoglycan DD-metalloendopeptidase family protein [Alphaproteobacteria bacterium]|jgi:murein DD-endopeptidase MepM/ murein hydrolase activator NlpD|nr:peptidoglycan DD-metalloendopeptidase family protein [Alphaproteobacteria bacterium]
MPYILAILFTLLSVQTFALTATQLKAQKVRIESLMQETVQEKENLAREKASLFTQETEAKETFQTKLHTFHDTTKMMLKLRRMPKEALAVQGILTLSHKRNRLLSMGQDNLQGELSSLTASLSEYLKLKELIEHKEILLEIVHGDIAGMQTAVKTIENHLNGSHPISKKRLKTLETDIVRLIKQKNLSRFFVEQAKEQTLEVSQQGDKAMPVSGRITRKFREEDALGLHSDGIDIQTGAGSEVMPTQSGKVVYSGPFKDYGTVVILDHGSDLYSVYGNLGIAYTKEGETLTEKTPLGTLPKTGKPTLYFEIRKKGHSIDPVAWLKSTH